MPRFRVLKAAAPDGWTDWELPVMRRYRLGCCDCGLVHDFDFRIVTVGGRKRIQLRARRNNRSTAGCRRAAEKKAVKDALR